MAARKLDLPGGRRLTLEERVNIAEGEDTLSEDSDGLDIVRHKHKSKGKEKEISLDDYIDDITQDQDAIMVSSDTEHGSSSDAQKRKRIMPPGERVAFSENEDSDAEYVKFKKRKGDASKKAAAARKVTKARSNKSSMVGRKSRTPKSLKDGNRNINILGDDEDDESALMETTLPEYLKQRRTTWESKREKLGNAGLLIPPSYDDLDFSDDERMSTLEERPSLPRETPQRGYEDVMLQYSAGVIPAPIAQWLREYQISGAQFLHELFVYQRGGILGDDMGLGKTIQVIAFLTAAFGKTGDARDIKRMRKMRRASDERWYPRILIIAPGGLMANWKNELSRWGWWHVAAFHGTNKDDAIAAATKGRVEIVITSYGTYRLNASEINGVRWDCVIADECHILKERTAEITKQMNDINALCRIGLTGTAIQNKYEELWTLLNWTNPGHLGPISTWKSAIAVPLKLGQSHDATVSQLAKARRTAEKLVGNLLPKFFLRRMKTLIAHQLPKKSDVVVFCPLTNVQATAYNNLCDSELIRTIRESALPCTCGSGKKQGWCCYTHVDDRKWQDRVFPVLMTLQKLANNLALLVPAAEMSRDKHDVELEALKLAVPDDWEQLYADRDSLRSYANQAFCGKWKVLKKLLKLWHENGDKVLVFSHSRRLLTMLHQLFRATTSYNVSYLDGSMSYDDRQREVDEFNAAPSQFVFLISTKAGGVGLNITSANKVVVVDPNWNPSWDQQAQDRAYRIGQTRDVEVFRLVSAGTIEEIVYARQIYKQQQANIGYNASNERRYFKGVQDQKDHKGEIFGLANMLAPQSDNVVLQDIINKTNVAETRAGVEIAGLDLEASRDDEDSDDEDAANKDPLLFDEAKEDAAMSQVAASIIDEPGHRRRKARETAKKKDPVQAILAAAGVTYTHENAEVIGTSKIETKLSSRAQKAGGDLDWNGERAFAKSQESQGAANGASKASIIGLAGLDDEEYGHQAGETVRYRYKPPEDVRKRQFCSMAKWFGYEDISEFALVVEGWTMEQRRDCLEKWYRERRKALEV